jgi:hypothetical protein
MLKQVAEGLAYLHGVRINTPGPEAGQHFRAPVEPDVPCSRRLVLGKIRAEGQNSIMGTRCAYVQVRRTRAVWKQRLYQGCRYLGPWCRGHRVARGSTEVKQAQSPSDLPENSRAGGSDDRVKQPSWSAPNVSAKDAGAGARAAAACVADATDLLVLKLLPPTQPAVTFPGLVR